MDQPPLRSDVNIMLLGMTGAGKSASGNTILGGDRKIFQEGFSPEAVTMAYQSEQIVVEGQTITVIDTVGLSNTAVRQIGDAQTEIEKILQNQCKCLDVFLLVIKLGVVERNVMQWIKDNFGKKVLKHIIVLFTHADQLHDPIEDYVSKCETLQSIIDQCSGIFHAFNNKVTDQSQVTELLDKINILKIMNEYSRYTEQDYKMVQRGIVASGTDLRIVLVGKTGSGKSSTGNTILGQEYNGKYFTSAVSAVSVTKTCESREVKIGKRKILVIDTPGLFDTMSEQNFEKEMGKCVKMSVPGPHVFLLVIRVGRFTEEEKNAVKWIQENFGEKAADYTIILFTHADALEDKPLHEYIRESNDLQALVGKCGGRFHSFNNKDIRNHSQVKNLLEKIEKMVERNGGQHYTDKMFKRAQIMIAWEAFKPKAKVAIGGAAVVAGTLIVAAAAVEAAGGTTEIATKTFEAARAPVVAAATAAAATGGTVAAAAATAAATKSLNIAGHMLN